MKVAAEQKILEKKYERIWQKYYTYKQTTGIIRSGYALCGVYDMPQKNSILVRPESDAEHMAAATMLLWLITREFPDVLSPIELSSCLITMLTHDLPELGTGDIPDDGSRDKSEKDQSEYKHYAEYMEDISGSERTVELFQQFQEHKHEGAVLYIVDKLEAVLQTIIYEKKGTGGSLLSKVQYHGGITSQDDDFVRKTGHYEIYHVWAAHFMSLCGNLTYYPIALGILHAAMMSVKNSWFIWCKPYFETVIKDFDGYKLKNT